MSSSTRLLVLGVVKIFQPVHGYEVRRELMQWHAHEWASVQPGSIYNALKSLTRDGCLEVVGTDQVGGRPERTSYQLTAAGNEEFQTLLRSEWWTVRTPADPLMAAVSFLSYVSRDEAIAALEHRIAQVHGYVRSIAFATQEVDGVQTPLHVREMHRLLNARIGAEVAWATELIARLRNHEYVTSDDPVQMPAAAAAAAPGPAAKPRATRRSPALDPPAKRVASATPAKSLPAGRRSPAVASRAKRVAGGTVAARTRHTPPVRPRSPSRSPARKPSR